MEKISVRIKDLHLNGIWIIFEKAQMVKDAIRLELGEPDFDTPQHIKEAAKRAIDQGYAHYTSNRGLLELREAITKKLRYDNRIRADPETEILVTGGGVSAIFQAVLATIDDGEEVLVPDPGWPIYEQCVRLARGKPVAYPLFEKNSFRISLRDLRSRLSSKTKMVILNSPNNPTGSVLQLDDLEGVAKLAVDNDLLVLSDEVYEKIIYSGVEHISIASLPGMRDRTITVNGFSKAYAMTGWRLGYAHANAQMISEMSKINLFASTCANSIAQKAGIAALTGPQNCVGEMVKEYQKRRDFLTQALNETGKITCIEPKGTFYVFANISALNQSSLDFATRMLYRAKVALAPGSAFGKYGEGFARFSYAASFENLEKAVERITNGIA